MKIQMPQGVGILGFEAAHLARSQALLGGGLTRAQTSPAPALFGRELAGA